MSFSCLFVSTTRTSEAANFTKRNGLFSSQFWMLQSKIDGGIGGGHVEKTSHGDLCSRETMAGLDSGLSNQPSSQNYLLGPPSPVTYESPKGPPPRHHN